MTLDLVHPLKARPGDRIAVLSPSFAAAGAFPEVHEQAMRRLTEVTGLIPVEYPTTREVGATLAARAADINAAFADPEIRGILAVVGGDDQITVIPHLDADVARSLAVRRRSGVGTVLLAVGPAVTTCQRPCCRFDMVRGSSEG